MTESRVAEIMALTDELTEWMRDHEIPMDDQIGRVFDRLARLESALREPVEMSDELPPLPEPTEVRREQGCIGCQCGSGNVCAAVQWFTEDQMRDYARRAIIAAAGGRK